MLPLLGDDHQVGEGFLQAVVHDPEGGATGSSIIQPHFLNFLYFELNIMMKKKKTVFSSNKYSIVIFLCFFISRIFFFLNVILL